MEYHLAKKLDHPNIPKYICVFDNVMKGEVHVVMEYIQGQELLEKMQKIKIK
jgi:serine/threonine protein kinase